MSFFMFSTSCERQLRRQPNRASVQHTDDDDDERVGISYEERLSRFFVEVEGGVDACLLRG